MSAGVRPAAAASPPGGDTPGGKPPRAAPRPAAIRAPSPTIGGTNFKSLKFLSLEAKLLQEIRNHSEFFCRI